MFDSKAILRLYTDVLYGDVANHCIKDLDISARLSNMAGVYSQGFGPMKVVDYNGIVNRCAYLHKYAPIYTAIVCSTMQRILCDETTLKFRLESGVFRMCSLGGGPGTDVVGVLAALDATIGSYHQWHTSVSVVDYMEGWKSTFRSVVNELTRTEFSPVSSRFAVERFSWKYVQGNLLDVKKYKVWDAVTYSSLVTMVKCLSTFRSKDVQRTIRKTFRTMSFGSFILIIDDVAEELTEIILRMACDHQLIAIFGPFRNESYSFDELKVTRFGHSSCHQAAVTSMLLMKPLFNPMSFFVPKFQSPVPRCCVKCGDLLYVCSKCSVSRDFRSSLYSFFKEFSQTNNTSYERKTPLCSRSPSPIQPRPTGNNCTEIVIDENFKMNYLLSVAGNNTILSNSVVIEVPE